MRSLAGTGRLLALALRRDRFVLPIVLVATAALIGISVGAVVDLYPTQPQRDTMAHTLATSPALLMMRGAPMGASTGALGVVLLITVLSILVALVTTFAVVRHTRQGEELGRTELLLAAPVGRHAPLAAALLLAALLDLGLGLVTAAGFVAGGEAAADALAFGAAVALLGASYAGVAAITSQVASTSRAANAAAAFVVGGTWLVRGIANVAGSTRSGGTVVDPAWPTWLSPLGWAEQVRAYGADGTRWWPLAVPVLWTAAAVATAVFASARRDLGAGIVAQRPGPPRASRLLAAPIGIAWRTQRTAVLGWLVGISVMGVAMGTLIDSVRQMLADNPELEQYVLRFGGGDTSILEDAYVSAITGMLGLVATVIVLQVLLAPHGEEASGRIEAVLASAVSRLRWLGSYALVALGAGTVVLLAAGIASGASAALAQGDAAYFGDLLVATVAQLPAVVVVGGALLLVFGLVPRHATGIGVLVIAWCILVGQFGELLGLPDLLQQTSPFTHVPKVPIEDVAMAPELALLGVGAALALAGLVAFARRDLQPGA